MSNKGGRSIKGRLMLVVVFATICLPISISADAQSDSATTWNANGTSLYSQGKYSEALQAFSKAIELNPMVPQIWYNKGNALYSQGKYDEAITAYDRVVELDPQYAYAWFAKGKALNYLKKYEEAIQALDKVIKLNPNDSEAWNLKGFALNALNLSTMANDAFDRAIECDSNNALAWYNKGLALVSLGRSSEAETAFAKAKELGYTGSPTEASVTKDADPNTGQSTKPWAKVLSGYKPRDYVVPLNPHAQKYNDTDWDSRKSIREDGIEQQYKQASRYYQEQSKSMRVP